LLNLNAIYEGVVVIIHMMSTLTLGDGGGAHHCGRNSPQNLRRNTRTSYNEFLYLEATVNLGDQMQAKVDY